MYIVCTLVHTPRTVAKQLIGILLARKHTNAAEATLAWRHGLALAHTNTRYLDHLGGEVHGDGGALPEHHAGAGEEASQQTVHAALSLPQPAQNAVHALTPASKRHSQRTHH